jgi:hypothetical protein
MLSGFRAAYRTLTAATLASLAALAPTLCRADDINAAVLAAQQASIAYIQRHQLSDGAIKDNNSYVMPYFANFAALALARTETGGERTRAWMRWYVGHLNDRDVWGVTGSVYDYDASSTTGRPRLSADSIDSYGATFLSVARAAWDFDPSSHGFVRDIEPRLLEIARSIEAMRQPSGLTWSKPSTRISYLEDNCEVFRGLTDLASIENDLHHPDRANAFSAAAERTRAAIEATLWRPDTNRYADFVDASGKLVAIKPAVWKSAVSELFPILYGVIDAKTPRALEIYARFNEEFPRWPELDKPDQFAWALVADVAAIMGDTTRAQTFIQSIQPAYEARNFPWPWHVEEAAFVVIVVERLRAPAFNALP